MSRPLYSIIVTLKHSLTEENEIGNLLADALREMFNSDIGIINSMLLKQYIPPIMRVRHGSSYAILMEDYYHMRLDLYSKK